MRGWALSILAVPAVAFAESPTSSVTGSPVSVVAGSGMAMQRHGRDQAEQVRTAPSGFVEAGYRIDAATSIVAHAALARGEGIEFESASGGIRNEYPFTYTALQLGIGLHFTLFDRVWLTPWLGIERVSVEGGYTYLVEDQDAFVVGTSIGVDVLAWSGHRVALYGQGSGSERLASASFGLSYRYWSP